MKIGSLFSGYGGLDMAVANVTGATTAWVSDIDKGACKILAHRYPDVPNLGDIAAVDWSTVEPVDILTGGFPCQDVSHAGKRAGIRPGTRSGLWTQMAYAIDQLRPRLVVIENVRGLLSAAAHSDMEPCAWCLGDRPSESALRALGAVLGGLADLGYDAIWQGLRAADVSAPHGRFRVFIVAHPADAHDGRRWEPDPRLGRVSIPDTNSGESLTLLPTPQAQDERHSLSNAANRAESGRQMQLTHVIGALLPTPTAADAGSSGGGYNGQTNVTLTDATVRHLDRFGSYASAIARWEQALGRPAPEPTEPTGRDGAHRLSAAFVEWMMGLPAGWVTDVPHVTRNEALKACGNGVVPQQAEAALRHMLAAIEVAA